MRKLIAAAFALLLSGCWMGSNLYSASDARPAMPPGLYRLEGIESENPTGRVLNLPNGMTQFGDGDERLLIGFVPLDAEGRIFASWVPDHAVDRAAEPVVIFNLVERLGDDVYIFYLPTCDGEDREIARAAGAVVELGPSVTTCTFDSRASLEDALRRLRPRPEREYMRLVRIGDGER